MRQIKVSFNGAVPPAVYDDFIERLNEVGYAFEKDACTPTINLYPMDTQLTGEKLRLEIDELYEEEMSRPGYLVGVMVDHPATFGVYMLARAPYWACENLDDALRRCDEPRSCRGADGCAIACINKDHLVREILARVFRFNDPKTWTGLPGRLTEFPYFGLREILERVTEEVGKLDLEGDCDVEQLGYEISHSDNSAWADPKDIPGDVVDLIERYFPQVSPSIMCTRCHKWISPLSSSNLCMHEDLTGLLPTFVDALWLCDACKRVTGAS